MDSKVSGEFRVKILETPEEMEAVEDLQRIVWPDSETDIVPLHALITYAHNGGLIIGAFSQDESTAADENAHLIGFVYGFPGLYFTPDGPRPKHCSHQMGVLPSYRNQGVGFLLKRAQWQMVRHQSLDLITWTFDPLLSRNAQLNITKLGAVSNTYLREFYGEMRDGLNTGLPSDRLQVDWWVNSRRVERRLSKRPRLRLDLAHFLAAGAEIINRSQKEEDEWPRPAPPSRMEAPQLEDDERLADDDAPSLKAGGGNSGDAILLVEIPSDFLKLKEDDRELAVEWRLHIRALFEDLFARGYIITDFVHLPGGSTRSFYVLSHGESTL